jgi:SNF2 family DNA or RNA helicase
MRFLENKYAVCNNNLTSVGAVGIYAVDEMKKKFAHDRQRVLMQRHQQSVEKDVKTSKEEESDHSVAGSDVLDVESDEDSEGSFEPDSEDEKLVRKETGTSVIKTTPISVSLSGEVKGEPVPVASSLNPTESPSDANLKANGTNVSEKQPSDIVKSSPTQTKIPAELPEVVKQETTRSLAYRLLEMDIGYSSDEGGDEDCAYFLDGVDTTFSTHTELKTLSLESTAIEKSLSLAKGKRKKQSTDESDEKDSDGLLPAKKTQFMTLGDRAKLHAAISLTDQSPDPQDFENFPLSSQKEIDAQKDKEAMEEQSTELELEETSKTASPPKSVKRSTVKVEQVSVATGEIVRIWANADIAAATLQLPPDELKGMLRGEYDEDLGDEIGGYRWRYAAAGAEVSKIADNTTRGSKKGKDAFLEFRDKLYDPAEPHIYKNGNRLRDYQVDGVNWLASTWYKRYSCILADEVCHESNIEGPK